MKRKICILGGGLSGCTIGRLFKDNGDDVTIFEKENKIGGACKDFWNKKGACWVNNFGAHLLHFNKETEEARKFLISKTELVLYDHQVMCLGHSEFSMWPPNAAHVKLHNILKPNVSFFYEYISSYSMKFWGQHWNNIKEKVMKRFKFKDYYNTDFFEGEKVYIPKNGYTNVFKDLTKNIPIRINTNNSLKWYINNFDLVICTAPIDKILKYKFGRLGWRGIDFTFEIIKTNGDDLLVTPVMNLNTHPKFIRMVEYQQLNTVPKCNGTNRVIGFEEPSNKNKLYPINDRRNTELLERYQTYAKNKFSSVYFLGRLSEYKYKNMNEAIQDAMDLFNKLKGGLNDGKNSSKKRR